jgi:hypothetical protein
MNRGGEQGAVVVTVDDDGSAADAVDRAAAEAANRGCPLRIVHAFRPPLLTRADIPSRTEHGARRAATTATSHAGTPTPRVMTPPG